LWVMIELAAVLRLICIFTCGDIIRLVSVICAIFARENNSLVPLVRRLSNAQFIAELDRLVKTVDLDSSR
jgi:hypothetical protein